MNQPNGDGAAGAAESPAVDSNEIDMEMMNSVAARLGTTIPQPKAAAKADAADDSDKNEGADHGDADDGAEGADKGDDAEGADQGGDLEDDAEKDGEAKDGAEKAAGKKAGEEYTADTAKMLNSRLKDLPAETRKTVEGIIGARIGQVVAKERGERDRIGARVEELTAERDALQLEKGPRYVSSDVHPTLMLESDKQVADRAAKIQEYLDWAEDNADGIEPTGEPGEDGYKAGYTKEQIRAQARIWRKEKDEIIPQVRENLRARARGDAALKEVMPELFDAKSPEYKTAESVLNALPQLRRFANCNALLAQFVAGGKVLEEKFAAKGKKTDGKAPPAGKAKEILPPRKQAPRAPGGGTNAKGSVVTRERDKPDVPEAVKKVYQDPTNKKNFQDAVSAALGKDFN